MEQIQADSMTNIYVFLALKEQMFRTCLIHKNLFNMHKWICVRLNKGITLWEEN